jgi:hypothetical protein
VNVRHLLSELDKAGYHLAHGVCPDELMQFIAALGPIRVDPRSPEPIREIRPQVTADAKPTLSLADMVWRSFLFTLMQLTGLSRPIS